MFSVFCSAQDTLNLDGSIDFYTISDDSRLNSRKYRPLGPNTLNFAVNTDQYALILTLRENKTLYSLSLNYGDGNYESKVMKFYENGMPSLIVSDYKLYNYTTEIIYNEGHPEVNTVYYPIGKFTKYYDNGFLYSVEEIDTTGLKSGYYYTNKGKLIRSCECELGKPLNGICTRFIGDINVFRPDGNWIFEKYKNGVKKRTYIVDADQKIVLNKWIRPKFLNRWIYRNVIDAYLLATEFGSFFSFESLPINNEKSKSLPSQTQDNW